MPSFECPRNTETIKQVLLTFIYHNSTKKKIDSDRNRLRKQQPYCVCLVRILRKHKDGHFGWCEALLTLILQSDGLDFIRISPSEASQRDIVFPDSSLVTKLPIDLRPEELPPSVSWSQMSHLDVCVANEHFPKISYLDQNITGKSII